jgi:hypothetical protein
MIGTICEIHIFDPNNFEVLGLEAKNMYYHQWSLTSNDPSYKVNRDGYYSLQEIQERLGHEGHTIDIFKIDCEGCEWYLQPSY